MPTNNEPAAETKANKDYIEYAGDAQYGTAFLSSHIITKGDPLWKRNGVDISKDLVWERDPSIPVGRKSPMRIALEDLPPGAAKALESLDGFKRVSA